ncbi:nucleotidyltransferase domain-containing protein [Phascolarctobacterium sp.]|uniref:nucleotidyltransferase domain-containing protein n=1 Tax=Phascolarctobacterium sp. TaxID=2049039 RepID=UPI00386DE04C
MVDHLKEAENITTLVHKIVDATMPVKVYLFGSVAENKEGADSDYDFYVVVGDDTASTLKTATKAYRAIRGYKSRPVDIVVGKESTFEKRKTWALSVEQEVATKGILVYGQ